MNKVKIKTKSYICEMNPTITVIIPVLNRENYLLRCLYSVSNQSEQPDEVIIVDNGSSDGSLSVATQWQEDNICKIKSIKILKETSTGVCKARQTGLERAHGDYVIFFDSDDEMIPELIEKCKKEIKRSNSDIICWRVKILLLNRQKKVPYFSLKYPIENHLIHSLLRTQGYAVKREFILNSGGWTKNLAVWNDLELGLRLLLKNPSISPLSEVLVKIHSTPESITGKNFSSKTGEWENTIQEMYKVIGDIENYRKKEQLRLIMKYREIILAAHYRKEGKILESKFLKNKGLENISGMRKILLIFAFYYTSSGGRGAWRIIRPFFISSVS